MNLFQKKISLFAIAGFVYLAGQHFRGVWFLNSSIPNLCGHASVSGIAFCDSPYLDSIGWPLIETGEIFFVIGILLLFANEIGFNKWLRFSYWFIPIAALILIFLTPVAVPLGEIDTATITKWLGILYIFITLCIVLVARLRTSK